MTAPVAVGIVAGPLAPARALGAGALLVALAGLVALPVAALVVPGALAPRPWPARVALDTLAIALGSTLAVFVPALLVALALTRVRVPGRAALRRVVALGVLVPPFVAPLGLLALTDAVRPGLPAIVLGQALAFLPVAVVRLVRVVGAIPVELERVAEVLGARPLTILRRVSLRMAGGGLLRSALVVLGLCLGDVATPLLLGGSQLVLATAIVGAAGPGQAALVLAALGTAAALAGRTWLEAGVVAGDWAERRRPERATSPLVRWTLGAVAWTVAAALVLLWVLVPLGSLGHWTWPALAPALGRSVLLGLGAAVAGTALALAAARRVEGPGAAAGRAIDALARVPAAVPGIAAGAGYLLVFGPMTGAGAGTLLLLVLVVAAWELPTTVRAARAALADADPALARAAASLGARGPVVLGRIVVPTLRPVAGWLFARLFAAGALATGTVIVLAGAGPDLGAVAVLTLAAAGATGAACAVATALLAVAGGAFLLGRAITGRRHGRTLPA